MASGPITSWQINGETVADFIFLGSKITADGDYSHKINTQKSFTFLYSNNEKTEREINETILFTLQ